MDFVTNGENGSNESCFQFTTKQMENITIMRVTVSVAAFLASWVVIVMIVALREYRSFIHRLILYLMVADIFESLILSLETVPVHHSDNVVSTRSGLDGVCVAIGFIAQMTAWIFYDVIIWIVVYIFLLAVFQYKADKRKHEIFGLVISIVFPFTFNWIPFIQGMYGLAGPWCWIRLTTKNCLYDYSLGVIYQFSLFYGPLVVLILASFVSFVAIIIVLCIQHLRQRTRSSTVHLQALKEALPLLVYPLLYDILCGFMVANRIYYSAAVAKGGKPYYPLWLAHGFADPARVLLPPLAFIFHPNTLRKLFCRKQRSQEANTANTVYIVPPEYSSDEAEPLIIGEKEVEQSGFVTESLFEGSTIHHSCHNTIGRMNSW